MAVSIKYIMYFINTATNSQKEKSQLDLVRFTVLYPNRRLSMTSPQTNHFPFIFRIFPHVIST